MAYKIKFHPRAIDEVEHVIAYYQKEVNFKTSEQFKTALDYNLEILSKSPFFEIKRNGFRIFPLFNFPYLLIFKVINPDIVEIYSLFNMHQNPTKYPKL